MKSLFTGILIFFFINSTFSQVKGYVTRTGGDPLAFVSIFLLNVSDSTLIKGTIANERGHFLIEPVKPGKYILKLSATGYQEWYSTVFELNDSSNRKDFDSILLKDAGSEMETVVIRAQKSFFQIQPGGITVNVENSVMTKGSSALSVLERSPGVQIDLRNNILSLNGKNGVEVMLNGKRLMMPMDQLINLLQSMSADDVEKIELLSTPPARFDAEGNAGLINIVLKKNKSLGTNGNISLTAGYGLGEKGTVSASLAHKTRNLDLFGSYTYSHNHNYDDLNGESWQNFPPLGGDVYVAFRNNNKYFQDNQNATISMDASLNRKTKIGSSVILSSSSGRSEVLNRRTINLLPDSLSYFTGTIKGTSRSLNVISTIYAEHQLREHERINFEVDYLSFNNNNPTNAVNNFLTENGNQAGANDTLFAALQKGFANTLIQVGMGKMDYTRQLTNKVTFETGGKATFTRNSGESGIESYVNNEWISRSETTNDILMKEEIGAGYASLNTQFSVHTNLTIGLRYEYSHTRMEDAIAGKNTVDQKLGNLFPNISFSHQSSDNSSWLLSYTKRISRPSYSDLSSFITYNDPFSVFTGNPFLKPTITHNLKLGYSKQGYAISVLFSRDLNPISRYQIVESPDKDLMYIGPQNLNWQNNLTLQFNKSWKIKPWWTMNLDLVGGWKQYREDYTHYPLKKTWFGYSVNFMEDFRLPKNYSIEISGWYNSISYNGTVKTNGYGSLNGGIKKLLNKNGGTVQLSVTDLASTIHYNSFYGTLTEEAFDGRSHVTFNPETRHSPIFRITYTRSFGSDIFQSRSKKNTGSGDEQERLR